MVKQFSKNALQKYSHLLQTYYKYMYVKIHGYPLWESFTTKALKFRRKILRVRRHIPWKIYYPDIQTTIYADEYTFSRMVFSSFRSFIILSLLSSTLFFD